MNKFKKDVGFVIAFLIAILLLLAFINIGLRIMDWGINLTI